MINFIGNILLNILKKMGYRNCTHEIEVLWDKNNIEVYLDGELMVADRELIVANDKINPEGALRFKFESHKYFERKK